MGRDINVDQIKKLWVLDLVVQTGSLRQAALKAKVSPSAVSQTLTSLESSIGKPLLIRERGFVVPTQDALEVLEVVRPAFDAFDRLRGIGGLPVPKISWINFGTYESIAIDLLPGLIHNLKQKLPNLRVGLRISRSSNLLTMVRKGELCSALVTESEDLDRFYTKVVAEDRLGLFVSKIHPIANLGWSAIEHNGWGSLAPGKRGMPRYFVNFIKRNGLSKPTILSDSFETLRAAAAAGTIVSVLPHRVAKRSNDLIELHLKDSPLKTNPDAGKHKIVIASQLNCNREETDFLAVEIQKILNSQNL